MAVNLELLLDTIADRIITSPIIDQQTVLDNQKTIRNGIISLGRTNADKLILFEKDIKANKEDLETSGNFGDRASYTLQGIADILTDTFNIIISDEARGILVTIDDVGSIADGWDITTLLMDDESNPLNVSQFVNIDLTSSDIIPAQANEFLDTNIYELLGGGRTRQDRIDDFFIEFQNLTAAPPEFLLENGMVGETFSSDDYSTLYDITHNPEGNIPRLDVDEGEDNIGKTLQSLRDTLDTYLIDIDEELDTLEDQRPTYQNQSDGYLKFRNLNQGIIIRNTNQEFVEGLDPSNPTYLNTDGTGGFTITMWVRFLDKVSEGTLFNFGNPLREDNPFGFSLETFVLNADDEIGVSGFQAGSTATWGQVFRDGVKSDGTPHTQNNLITQLNSGEDFFKNSNTERFVRLIVRDTTETDFSNGNYVMTNGRIYDSHLGAQWIARRESLPQFGVSDDNNEYDHAFALPTNTRIPEDFNEWYFICATYNPLVNQDYGFDNLTIGNYNNVRYVPDFWLNHIDDDGGFTNSSDYGNRAKVEIISRSELLRARGYKG